MAKLIDVPGSAGPQNEGERRVVNLLLEQLPEGYWVAPNVEISSQNGQILEYDAVVVSPHGIYVLEIKEWTGHIEGDDIEWLVSGGSRKAPLRITERKAKVLKSRLVERVQALARVWVEAAVVLAVNPASLVLTPEGLYRLYKLDTVLPFLLDASQIGQRESAVSDLVNYILQALNAVLRAHSSPVSFGNYEVLEVLDQNGDEALYRAKHRLMPGAPPVRLRVVSLSPYKYDEQRRSERRAVVIRETETLLRMGSHPNVIAAREFFEDDSGRIVLVQDDTDGRTLRQRLATGTPMTVQERLDVLASVCRALMHAHSHGIIHRQVEPRSISLTEDGTVRLGRLGLAKLLNGAAQTVWHDPQEADVDIRYVAPEVMNPRIGEPSPATDLYSLGCVAFELFEGHPPFEAPAQAFDGLPALPSDTPPPVAELIGTLVKGDPAQRPNNARDVLACIQSVGSPDTSNLISGPKDDYSPGDLIDGKFEVKARLGGGGFSTVYKVYRAFEDREYALKVFNSPAPMEKVRREVEILRSVGTKPHVVKCYWADQTRSGQWYLVTELIDGESLEAYASGEKRLSAAQSVELMKQLLSALESIHPRSHRIEQILAKKDQGEGLSPAEFDELQELQANGIVHRDIKPQNLMLTQRGDLVVIDFNIASRVGQPVNTLHGTTPFMPPDILPGVDAWDVSPDLFAAGVVCYLLLCNEHPYENWQPIIAGSPRDPRQFRPELSAELVAFLTKACAPRRADRFQTAGEMSSALEAITAPISAVGLTPAGLVPLPPSLVSALANAEVNQNPIVTEFLAVSSQARRTNKGTRGMDDLARATYVRTRLDEDLAESIRQGKHRLILVTGNAGDGKTAFIQQVEESMRLLGAATVEADVNGSHLLYASQDIFTLYDGSQDQGDVKSDAVLRSFLKGYAASAPSDSAIRLAAINEGRLRDFLLVHRNEFVGFAENVIAALDEPGKSLLTDDIVLVNLNLRSVTAMHENSIFTRQLNAIVNGPFWQPCNNCDYRLRCPIKYNVDTFRDSTSGAVVTERLRRLVDLIRLARRRHLTMRDVRSLISHVLFRDRNCAEIAQLLQSDEPIDVLDLAYFQAPGGLGSVDGSAIEQGAGLLSVFDVALVANPNDDRAIARGEALRRVDFTDRSGDYMGELIASTRARAGSGYDSNVPLARLAHQAARRQFYFERADDGWQDMFPYTRLRQFLDALAPDNGAARDDLRREVIRAISIHEGVPDTTYADLALWLATSDDTTLDYRCFRRYPVADFGLRIIAVDAPYIESEPDRLELFHRPSGATLDIDIDLMEILDRLQEGSVPSAYDGGAFLINLSLFKHQLLTEPSSELILASDHQLMRISRGQSAGSISLSKVGQPQ